MDETIQMFVETYFSDEMQDQIFKSFGLFNEYEHHQADSNFIDIIMDESNLGSNMMIDLFHRELNKQLDRILEHHSIKMIEGATLYHKNELLTALALVQHIQDYSGIIRTLESFEPDEIQFADIFSELCLLDKMEIIEVVEFFNPKILKTLKKYIYQKEENKPITERADNKVEKNFKFFCSVFKQEHVGSILARAGTLIGQPCSIYLDLVQDGLIKQNDEETAMNILSVLFLSRDGFNSPILAYRKYSYRLIQDLDKVTKIEIKILALLSQLNEHKKAADEQARLHQTVVEVKAVQV